MQAVPCPSGDGAATGDGGPVVLGTSVKLSDKLQYRYKVKSSRTGRALYMRQLDKEWMAAPLVDRGDLRRYLAECINHKLHTLIESVSFNQLKMFAQRKQVMKV